MVIIRTHAEALVITNCEYSYGFQPKSGDGIELSNLHTRTLGNCMVVFTRLARKLFANRPLDVILHAVEYPIF